jgi:hypothetical protein
MATAGELFDGPFWIQVGLLALFALLTPLPAWMGLLLAFGLTLTTRLLSAKFASTSIGAIFSAGNIKRQHEFSRQESMIARGKFDEAAESFGVHLMEFPDDIHGRYRLATLHLRERNDPAAAETELLNIRRRPHNKSMAMLLANHFVDLYRATAQKGKLMAELTKMMKEWPGTPMAEGAAKLLEETRRDLA